MTQELLTVKIDQGSVTLPIRSILQALLDGIAAPQSSVLETPPLIGERWPGKGGFYAGIARGYNVDSDNHLILVEYEDEKLNWDAAMKWASKYCHNDIPTRRELALLYANVPEQFTKDWYWSSERNIADRDYAWAQNFETGQQISSPLVCHFKVRAVRRIVVTR